MEPSPLHHITDATRTLGSLMSFQGEALIKFGAFEDDHTPPLERLATLTSELNAALPQAKEGCAVVEENLPLFLGSFDRSNPQLKERADDVLTQCAKLATTTYQAAERFQRLYDSLEPLCGSWEENIERDIQATLAALESSATVYNRFWFSYSHILEDFLQE